jgi:Anti-sigma-K factor rskA
VKKEEIISSGLLEMYAIGNTTAEETAMVHQAFINWPDVKEDVNSMEEVMENYALINATNISPYIKEKLFLQLNLGNTIKTTSPVIEQASVFSIKKYKNIAAALTGLLIGSAILNIVYFNKVNTANTKYAEIQSLNKALKDEEEAEKAAVNIVRSKFSLPLKLKPDAAPKYADAKIYWLTNTGEIYVDPTNLPTAPAGKQYQLWAIVNGKAIDGGLIKSNTGNVLSFQKMKTFGKAQAFAITLEVEGGVVASKEKPYVIVNL